tara:strand:- start:53 stop:469 length:417 start_codon:yes stop_codon:yes gene_type:complete
MGENYKLSKNINVIEEICSNHNGDMELAYKPIDEAKDAGCDCVKFQSWDRDHFVEVVYEKNSFLDDGRELEGSLEDQVKKYALSFENLKKLREHCEKINIDFASYVFKPKQVEELLLLKTAFIKIASMDFNYDLLISK